MTVCESVRWWVAARQAVRYIMCIGGGGAPTTHHKQMATFTATSNLSYAERIGSVYTDIIDSYCADDNAYWPKEVERIALACPVDAHAQFMAAIYGRAD